MNTDIESYKWKLLKLAYYNLKFNGSIIEKTFVVKGF